LFGPNSKNILTAGQIESFPTSVRPSNEWDVYCGVYQIGVKVGFTWTVKDSSGRTKSGKSRLHLVWKGRTNDDLSLVSWKETVNPML
jgi:hypothetical protein